MENKNIYQGYSPIRRIWLKIPRTRWDKRTFFMKLENRDRVLDVGCGNNSPAVTKFFAPGIYYVGVDVGDYNNTSESLGEADEYHVFAPEYFADGINSLDGEFDAVISSHNIEHNNFPFKTLKAMCHKLAHNGRMYLSFPDDRSVNFPSREGTLNFYDDPTHIYLPDLKEIINCLRENGVRVVKVKKGYRPLYYRFIGGGLEPLSRKRGKVLPGTWAYWGFETVIWAVKG